MRIISLITLLVLISSVVGAQTRRRSTTKTVKPIATTPTPTPSPSPEEKVVVQTAPKKNERPTSGTSDAAATKTQFDPTYRYEFAQPEFAISRIIIEHDDTGRGSITFTRKLQNDTETDPIQVSSTVLERINAALTNLNFLDSTESYQYEKDYSHLGVTTFRWKHGDKQRSTTFNYTTNKDAKTLSDEYRKLGNQAIWIFDITVARENQPLEAPRIIDSLDGLLRRDEIADPTQLVPLLNGLKDDERVPLIARNHAAKLAERIGKGKK